MLETGSASQLQEWEDFAAFEPWGFEVGNRWTGVVAATIANTVRSKDKPAYKPENFGIRPAATLETAEQSPEEMLAIMKAMAGNGGKNSGLGGKAQS